MKDLRPPTLQTYTDKTYKYINSRHIYTQGISYPRTHIAPNTWHTGIHKHIRYTRILTKDCAILKQLGNKSTPSIAHVFTSPPTGFNCHGAGIWTVVCSNEKGLHGPFSRISSALRESSRESINPVLKEKIPSFCPTVSLAFLRRTGVTLSNDFPVIYILLKETCNRILLESVSLASVTTHHRGGKLAESLEARCPSSRSANELSVRREDGGGGPWPFSGLSPWDRR